jgi:uncharacterized protein (TIRG00374 family)
MLEDSSPPAPRKLSLWSLAKIILGLGLVVFVVSRTSWAELVSLLSRVSPFYLAATIILFLLLSLLKALQYHVLMPGKVPYPQALSVAIAQNAVSNFVATSAGVATYMTMLKVEQHVKLSRSASVFVLIKIADLVSLWLGLLISLVFVRKQIGTSYPLALSVLVLVAIGLVILGLGLLGRRIFASRIQAIFERLGLVKLGIVRRLSDFLNAVAEFDQGELLRLLAAASRLSFLYFVVTIAWTYASLHTFALQVSVWQVAFVTAMLQLLSIVPVQVFGGLGVSETASLYLFSLFGFTYSELAAVLIGIRLLFYATNLLALLYLPLYALLFGRPGQRS